MKLVVPYQTPFLAREAGGSDGRRLCRHRLLVDARGQYPLAKLFVEAFDKKYGYKPEWGAENAYMDSRSGPRPRRPAASIRPMSSSRTRPAASHFIDGRRSLLPQGRYQLVRPVIIVKGKTAKDMKNKEETLRGCRNRACRGLMQKPDAFGCNLGGLHMSISPTLQTCERSSAEALAEASKSSPTFLPPVQTPIISSSRRVASMGELIEGIWHRSGVDAALSQRSPPSGLRPYSVIGLLRTEVVLVERACSKQNAIGTSR